VALGLHHRLLHCAARQLDTQVGRGAAIFEIQVGFFRFQGFALHQNPLVVLANLLHGSGVEELLITLADHLGHRGPEQLAHRAIGKQIVAVAVFEVNVGIHVFQDVGQLLFALTQLFFGLLALRDIGNDPDQTALLATGVNEALACQVSPELGVISAPILPIHIDLGNGAGQQGQHLLTAGLSLGRVHQSHVFNALQRVSRAAKHLGHALVGLRDAPLLVNQKNRDAGGVHNLPQHGLALPQGFQHAVEAAKSGRRPAESANSGRNTVRCGRTCVGG